MVLSVSQMSRTYDVDLLHGEEVELVGKPHPLSFLKYHLFAVYLIGVAVFLGWFHTYLKSNEGALRVLSFLDLIFGTTGMGTSDIILLILFWAILLLTGLAVGTLWVSRMPVLYMVLVGAAGTALEVYFLAPYETVLVQKPMIKLFLLGATAIATVILTEAYRRRHLYLMTNYRIMTRKGFIRKEEREIMYHRIADVYVKQGVLGRLFNFGTVIPISASGFNLSGGSQAFAAAAVSLKGDTVGGGAGGSRSIQRPRAPTQFSLYGIREPRKIRIMISSRQLESRETPILKRYENLLRGEGRKESKFDERI